MIRARWTGTAFEPAPGAHLPDMTAGEWVVLDVDKPRSRASHNHFFAQVGDYWQSWPEALAGLPYAKTPDTLRKHALIATGHCHVRSINCGTDEAAQKVATWTHGAGMKAAGYCITDVRGPVVTVWTAKTQRKEYMAKAEFEQAKADVLDWLQGKVENA